MNYIFKFQCPVREKVKDYLNKEFSSREIPVLPQVNTFLVSHTLIIKSADQNTCVGATTFRSINYASLHFIVIDSSFILFISS